jgi:hypothetical protein
MTGEIRPVKEIKITERVRYAAKTVMRGTYSMGGGGGLNY